MENGVGLPAVLFNRSGWQSEEGSFKVVYLPMRKLSGIYRTDRKKTKRYSIEIPSTWEELKPGQFGTAIYLLQVTTQADPQWIRLSLLALLFEKHFPILSGVSAEDKETLLNGMQDEFGNVVFEGLPEFFYTEEPPLKNFYPELKINKIKLIPAAEDLSNIGFGEWCFLDTFFEFYFRSQGDEMWLNRMIATVYRELDPDANENNVNYTGDLRQVFNENLTLVHADRIKEIPNNVKMAVFQWIAIALKQAKEGRPEVFPKPVPQLDAEGKPIPITPKENPENNASWMDIYADLIGPKFGTSDQLKKTNAFFVLDYLNKEQRNWQKYGS